jgi:hypothetical protein
MGVCDSQAICEEVVAGHGLYEPAHEEEEKESEGFDWMSFTDRDICSLESLEGQMKIEVIKASPGFDKLHDPQIYCPLHEIYHPFPVKERI